MGRGDKKTKKGKTFKGSFGKSRPARVKKAAAKKSFGEEMAEIVAGSRLPAPGKPSALLDTRVIYCGDCLEQLRNLRMGALT